VLECVMDSRPAAKRRLAHLRSICEAFAAPPTVDEAVRAARRRAAELLLERDTIVGRHRKPGTTTRKRR
jgi:hypothetical protein